MPAALPQAQESCLKSHLLFSCPDRRTMSKQLASKTTWQAPRFSSPLQADVLGLSSNTFHQETDLRSDPLAECKKAPNVCTFPSSHQSTLTVLARDGASRQERPNVLRHLASVQKKPQVEIPSKLSLVTHLGVQNKPWGAIFLAAHH